MPSVQPIPQTPLRDDPQQDAIWKRYLDQLQRSVSSSISSYSISSISASSISGIVGVSTGGTGFSSYFIGDLLYADTVSTLAKLNDVASGNVLLSGGVSTAPVYGKVGLTSHVSSTLPVANGGTGVSTLTGIPLGSSTSAFTSLEYVGWTTPTFDSANFTGNGSMTWTVESGDIVTYAYTIIGKTMIVNFYIVSSSVGGTLNNLLQIAIPASKTSIGNVYNACAIQDAGGGAEVGAVTVAPSGSVIRIQNLAATNWSTATNNTAVFGSITFGIN